MSSPRLPGAQDVLALLQGDFGAEKEAEQVKKHQKSQAEINKLTVDESLTDAQRLSVIVKRGTEQQRRAALSSFPHLLSPSTADSPADLAAGVTSILETFSAFLISEHTPAADRVLGLRSLCTALDGLPKLAMGDVLTTSVWPFCVKAFGRVKSDKVLLHLVSLVVRVFAAGIRPDPAPLVAFATECGSVSASTERRVLCCRVLGAAVLFGVLTPDGLKGKLFDLLIGLCQDTEGSVRLTMCEQLPILARVVDEDSVSVILTELLELAKDEEVPVKAAALRAFLPILPSLSVELRRLKLLPVLRVMLNSATVGRGSGSGSSPFGGLFPGAGGRSSGGGVMGLGSGGIGAGAGSGSGSGRGAEFGGFMPAGLFATEGRPQATLPDLPDPVRAHAAEADPAATATATAKKSDTLCLALASVAGPLFYSCTALGGLEDCELHPFVDSHPTALASTTGKPSGSASAAAAAAPSASAAAAPAPADTDAPLSPSYLSSPAATKSALLSFATSLAWHADVAIRVECCRLLPAVTACVTDRSFEEDVMPAVMRLMTDHSHAVRTALVNCLHVVAQLAGPLMACKHLRSVMIRFVQDDDDLVCAGILDHMCTWLLALHIPSPDNAQAALTSLVDPLLGLATHSCVSKSWRCQVRVLQALRVLVVLLPGPHEALCDGTIRLLERRIETGSTPVRSAAVYTAVWFMRHVRRGVIRTRIAQFLGASLLRASAWWRRALYIDAIAAAVWLYSRSYVKQYLLPSLIECSRDPVPNVRWRAVQALGAARRWLTFPKDAESISTLTAAAQELVSDADRHTAATARVTVEAINSYTDVDPPAAMPPPPSWYAAHPPSPPCLATAMECSALAARADPSRSHMYASVAWTDMPRTTPPSWTASDDFLTANAFDRNPFRLSDCAKGLFMPAPAAADVVGAHTSHSGAHSPDKEAKLAEAEAVMLTETLAEEEAEKRRVIEDRRAEARRAAADKDGKGPSSNQRARNWEQKRLRMGLEPRGGPPAAARKPASSSSRFKLPGTSATSTAAAAAAAAAVHDSGSSSVVLGLGTGKTLNGKGKATATRRRAASDESSRLGAVGAVVVGGGKLSRNSVAGSTPTARRVATGSKGRTTSTASKGSALPSLASGNGRRRVVPRR